MEKVSIIIPCYNQGHFLSDAIESALAQTYPNIEVIVVDDGSTDNTMEVVRKYPTVWLMSQKNKHLSGARNTGIKRAEGTWILPLDSDDKIHPEYVTKTLQCAKNNGSDIVSTWLETFGNENRRWGSLDVEPVYQNFLQKNHINCCSLFKKSMWTDLGGYDENMKQGFEDWDFWRRATRKGYKVNILTEYLFQYRKHGVSMFAEAQKKRAEIIDFMRKKESETGKLIDIVYPLKRSRYSDNELKFSLRSVEKHLTGWNKVWIIGDFPRWGNSELKYIATDFKHVKALNILENIKTACESHDISEDFLFMNDDHIFLENCDACTYPNYYSNEDKDEILKNRPFVDPYVEMINETYKSGVNMDYYDVHKPIIINKEKFLSMYRCIRFHSKKHGMLIKTLYIFSAMLHGTKTTDCILRTLEDGKNVAEKVKGNDLFSFHDDAVCKEFIQFLDKNYPIKSQFEQ